MRPSVRAENLLELIAVRLNLAPVPLGEAMFGMPMARSVMAGVRLGIFARLAERSMTRDELANELDLAPAGTGLLLDSLAALGHVRRAGDSYALTKRARRWLDPASESYVGNFLENCFDFWRWWDGLEETVRTGGAVEIHAYSPTDPHWRRYIRGQYELARLSAPEVAGALRLPREPKALLDVAGGHGWFSAAICQKHPSLKATVLDLPGSAAIGREITAETGMADRVQYVEGDALVTALGGPYDGALVFNLVHHLSPEQNVALLSRIRETLVPGGTIAVLDLFTGGTARQPDTAAFLGLFFYLTSGAATYSHDEMKSWLGEAGYERPRSKRIRRIPGQTLYEARNPATSETSGEFLAPN